MKTRRAWTRVFGVAGVAVLICGFWVLVSSQSSAKRDSRARTGASVPARGGASNSAPGKQDSKWIEAYAKLPLSFEENQGQTVQEVRFMSRGTGYGLFLTSQEAVISLQQSMPRNLSLLHRVAYFRALRKARQAGTTTVLRMGFKGANPTAQAVGVDRLPGKVNYFIGNNPKNWRTDVPSFARVKYADIYPGVDLVFYGNQRQLEYDFVVAPGTDPKVIELSLKGAQKLRIDSNGDLVLSLPGGQVVLQRPVVYQNVRGDRQEVQGRYVLTAERRITFAISDYDKSAPLIIDPVLNYSTYLGGSAGGDAGLSIAVDSLGDAFVTGTTFSTTFPSTPGGFGAGNAAGVAFVTEIDPTGTALLYTTYLGGTGGDNGLGIALDNSGGVANPGGNVYVTGITFSTDFPTTAANALKPTDAGASVGTSFISKINPAATGIASLAYSSYLGGTGGVIDFGNAVAADANGNAYITGITSSSPGAGVANFPITAGSAFQTTLGTTNGNAFLTKIDTTQSGAASLIYSTYLGGSGDNAATSIFGLGDIGLGVALDSSKNAYIAGTTSSSDFPTTATAIQPNTAPPAAVAGGTAFVSRIDTTQSGASSLVYSTFLGGDVDEVGSAIAVKPGSTTAYVTGQTSSPGFPTFPVNTFQSTASAFSAAFVSLIDTSLPKATALTYSTYLGENGTVAFGIAADSAGNAYVAGGTSSSTFPVTSGAFQPKFATGAGGEGFISKLNPGGNGTADLVYSTFFGGAGGGGVLDAVNGVAVDVGNNVYVTGVTASTAATFPVFPPTAFQTTLPAGAKSAAFIAKLTLIPTLVVAPTSLNFGIQPVGVASSAKTVTLTNNTSDAIPFPGTTITFSGTNAADFSSPSNTCGASIAAGASCTVSAVFTPSVAAGESATMVITVVITNGGISSSQAFNVSLSGTGSASAPGVGLAPASLDFGGQMLTTTSAAKTVTLTNTGTSALTITSIAASGDFAATSTGAGGCPISPATLPATAGSNTCTISVTFAPTALGARTGTLTITDNAGGSPHTVPLTGSGWDFTLTAPATGTVTAAAPLHFNATMTPQGGFNQAVALTCTGAPTGTTCTVVTPVTAADGVTAQTAQVTVTTTAMMLPPPSTRIPPVSIRQVVPLLLAMMLLFLLPRTKRLRLRVGMVAAMLMLVLLAGCSGPTPPVKPPVNATLTITGASTGTAGAVSHTAQVAVTIN